MKKVFVNGSFDLIQPGHLLLLKYARSLGDTLIVATDTDRRISELKGSGRPIFSLKDRRLMLESLKAVDYVWSFDSDEELHDICSIVSPDIMVKGSDHKYSKIIGAEFCKEIIFVERTDDSTTKRIQSIIDRGRLS